MFERTIDQIVIPTCNEHSEIYDLLCYALWIIQELCRDSDILSKLRPNRDLITLVQFIHTKTYADEHIRLISNLILEDLTGVSCTQRELLKLPPVQLTQRFGEYAEQIILGRDLGSLS